MNYRKIHNLIIERAKERIKEVGLEEHHIIPASCFPGKRKSKLANNKANLVFLTPKEHYLVHVCLVKMFPGDEEVRRACKMVLVYKRGRKYERVRSWLQETWIAARPVINCNVCNKDFTVNPYAKNIAKYCSYECSSKGRRNRYYTTCKQCGDKVMQTPARCERKYCSKECYQKSKGVYKVCLHCGEEFRVPKCYAKKKYCNKACTLACKTAYRRKS